MSAPQANDAEKNIEIWKVKELIKRLEAAYVPVLSLLCVCSWPIAAEEMERP